MSLKSDAIYKERQRALGDILIAECRHVQCSMQSIDAILDSGAPIDYKNSAPLKVAAKSLNFSLIRHLIERGASLNRLAISLIGSICDYKGYDDSYENDFFELIDFVRERADDSNEIFVPYINNLAVTGRLNKLFDFMKRYSLSDEETAKSIHERIIFEIINNGHEKMLAFIEKNRSWADKQTVDLCVSCDEWMVLEYILHTKKILPCDEAVAQAVYLGHVMTLNVLVGAGFNFAGKPLLRKKARQALLAGKPAGIDFLSKLGVM